MHDDDRQPSSSPDLLPLLLTLFFLSGLTALVYEVLWTRRLTLIFGHTVVAASTVLAAFMGGLGLGSLAGGRWADRPERQGLREFLGAYAILEAGIGVAGLASLPLLNLIGQAHLTLARGGLSGLSLQLASLVMASLVLLPPTLMMGATLPILVRGLVRRLPEGRLLGGMYGVNALGGCLGATLAGYLLLPTLGVNASLTLTALLNAFLGGLARWAARKLPAEPARTEEAEPLAEDPPPPIPGLALLPLAMGLAGAAAMLLEIGWTRGLVLTFGSSTYAFATILGLFLAGLGLGGLAYSLIPASSPRLATLGGVQLATGLWAGLAGYLLGLVPYLVWLGSSWAAGSFGAALTLQVGLTALILLGPTFLMGLAFPLAVELFQGRGLGHRISLLYLVNTLGCVVGAILAGFWLLPDWGAQATLKLGSLTLLGSGLLLGLAGSGLAAQRLPWLIGGSAAALLILALPRWNPALMSAGLGIYHSVGPRSLADLNRISQPFWYRDGMTSTVSLYATREGGLSMRVNGKVDASTSTFDLSTQYLLGYIPALYTRPRSAAVIGLGSGITAQALLEVPGLERVDCVELEPAVIQAQPYWDGYNGHVSRDSRLHVVAADGRTFLETSPRSYDIILSEPSNVWMAGVGNLYTREFYRTCKARLNQGGVMAQWFQNYAVGPIEMGLVINTFFDVFPHGSLWVTSVGEHDILLIGSRERLAMDLSWVRKVTSVPSIRRHLVALGLCSDEAILGHYVCGRDTALGMFGRARLNTDDRPALEFGAARHLYAEKSQRLQGLSGMISDVSRPLPEGIPPSPEVLQAAAEGWISSREADDLKGLFRAQGPYLGGLPLVNALAQSLNKVTPDQLVAAYGPALKAPATARLAAYILGLQLQSRGEAARAIPYYESASQAPPPGTEAQLWLNLGSCQMQLGDLNQATADYERSVQAGGGYAALTLLGDAWLRRDQPLLALQSYSQATSENQVYVPALWGRGQAFLAQRQYAQAARAFQEVLELVPTHLQALNGLAFCLVQLDDIAGAARAYRQILRYSPDNAHARQKLQLLEVRGPGQLPAPPPATRSPS